MTANAVNNAELEMKKNAYLGRIDIEKNELRLEEAQAKQKQLKTTFDLKRQGRAGRAAHSGDPARSRLTGR